MNDEAIKILFLSANPLSTTRIGLDEEIRAIDHALQLAEFRDHFDIKQHWAVRVSDIQSYLLRHNPHIVHFSGHGEESTGIILEDASGNSSPVSAKALSKMFLVLKRNIRCVVLNTCFSENQANAIAEHIDCVIGMSNAFSDKAAISFSASFYQALGFGQDIKTAFELGCVQLDLENMKEHDIPKLITVHSKPSEVILGQNSLIHKRVFAESESNEMLLVEIAITHWIKLSISAYLGEQLTEVNKIDDMPGLNLFIKLQGNYKFGLEVVSIQSDHHVQSIISRYLRLSKFELSNVYTRNEKDWVEPMLILVAKDIETANGILNNWRQLIEENIDSWVVVGYITEQRFEELLFTGGFV